MRVEYDEETHKAESQFPDIYISIYPAGHRVDPLTGKDEHYRGALLIKHGSEKIHLNALDIGDVLSFLTDPMVDKVRQTMTDEHISTNLLRAIIMRQTWGTPEETNHETTQ